MYYYYYYTNRCSDGASPSSVRKAITFSRTPQSTATQTVLHTSSQTAAPMPLGHDLSSMTDLPVVVVQTYRSWWQAQHALLGVVTSQANLRLDSVLRTIDRKKQIHVQITLKGHRLPLVHFSQHSKCTSFLQLLFKLFKLTHFHHFAIFNYIIQLFHNIGQTVCKTDGRGINNLTGLLVLNAYPK